jgi:uncharacterized membrane protein YhaH (DUF805 family)
VSFLFSPRGWIGRANYLRGMAIVMLVNLGLCVSLVIRPVWAWLAYPAMLLTLPAMVSVTTKRLHAIGCSGWFQLPVRVFAAWLAVMLAANYLRVPAPPPPTMFAVILDFAPALVADLALFLWLMLARTRPPERPVEEVFD